MTETYTEETHHANGSGTDAPDFGAYFKTVVDDAKGWADAQVALAKLSGSERIGKASGTLIIGVSTVLLITAVLVLCSIALAIWLGERMQNMSLGFLATAGIFAVVTVFFYFVLGPAVRRAVTLNMINDMNDGE